MAAAPLYDIGKSRLERPWMSQNAVQFSPIDVHVGPSWYLTQKHINFEKGEQIEVAGSRVKFGDSDALIVREIKKGGQTLALRNAQGIPLCSAGRRRPR